MRPSLSAVAALLVLVGAGCAKSPSESGTSTASVDTFVGTWRSVTPSLEFMRLSVESKSSERGTLAARLTFSGVAWEGSGQIEGDSLVMVMNFAGTTRPSGVIVARPGSGASLDLRVRSDAASPLSLAFVRVD